MSEDADKTMSWLFTPLGVPGSGRVRYGAAMSLYQAGKIGAEALEVYRICANLDGQDAVELLKERGLQGIVAEKDEAVTAIGRLVVEADRYLAGLATPGALSGPGIVDVRDGIAATLSGPVNPTLGRKVPTVVGDYLAAALASLDATHPDLAEAIRTATPHLNWQVFDQYPPDQIGPAFAAGNAFALIIGEDAPLHARDFDFGLFLIAPHVFYRDHHHAAPELYLPLTGPHGWRFAPNTALTIKPAHEPVWNDPHHPHATKVGAVPFLCLFAWTRDVNLPAEVIPATDWATIEEMRL